MGIKNKELAGQAYITNFGTFKFDQDGVLSEPKDLSDEQKESLLERNGFEDTDESPEKEPEYKEPEKGKDGVSVDQFAAKAEQPDNDPEKSEEDEENDPVDDQLENDNSDEEVEQDFESMTVKQLKSFAEAKNIELESTKKDDIISEIKDELNK